ncbi:Putative Glucosamine-6-phosphate isomerase [Lichtheimia ramosa]|uniref:Glucosamine-6-phosphate isomerase n=1 Tax=Lichtheimia ramosa TaxID=688394 RepID=A0A077WMY4_9FUNG|nr:Putative Glucosamine-6-phosphate isomerase [Lichtheimia ramosa]
MRLIVRENYEEVSSYVAYYVKERINQFAPTKERPFVLGLPTGSSPIGVYHKLVDFNAAGQLSFKHVVTFNMDEYVGLPTDHPQSYHTFMWNHLFKHVDIDKNNVHILDGNASNLDEECRKFEAEIAKLGGIELFLGGIGPDGHIAFNEPGSSLTSRTRVKTLAYETIIANARFFGGEVSRVPKLALTVGVATVMDAREVMLVITGAHKSLALAKCVEEGVNHMWTVSAIQMHPKGLIVCDEDATLELHVKTVKYFKSIEHVHHSIIGPHNLGLQGNLLRNMVDTNQAAKRRRRLMLQNLLNNDDHDGGRRESSPEDEAAVAAAAAVAEAGQKRKRRNSAYWQETSAALDVNP